ncbi:MAG: RNA polymerase sigma-70 factor (ECF subfamily) [Planctomycetota bacterium]|jgi:RNA polymerase sigma-70 factor (ECF subfamily)
MPPLDPDSDEALAAAAAQGSRAAFEELVDRFGGSVIALIERRIGDHHTAMDLAQEAWVRIFRALALFDANRSFRSWLFSIVLNVARDEGRRRERNRVISPDEFRDSLEVADSSERLADRDLINDSLGQVVEPLRTAMVLVDVEGLSYEEASECLKCAVGTVKSRVNRGRLAIRDS